MVQFDANAWLSYKTGQTSGYRFADPIGVARANRNINSDVAERTEYRRGLLSTAKGSISIFDKNGDGVLSKQEYINEQNYFHRSMTGEDADAGMLRKEFDALDYNCDGFIDYKERANEISYLDRTKETNKKNGVITSDSEMREARLLLKGNLPDELDYNYDSFNMKNLGEKGDVDDSLELKQSNVSNVVENGDEEWQSIMTMLNLMSMMGMMNNNSYNSYYNNPYSFGNNSCSCGNNFFGLGNNNSYFGNNSFGMNNTNNSQNILQLLLIMTLLSQMGQN